MFATGAGKGRIHAATSRPKAAPLSIETVKIEPGGGTRGRLDRMSDEQLKRGLLMHGNQSAKGKEIQAEVSRRKTDTSSDAGSPASAAATRSRDHAMKAEAVRLRAGGQSKPAVADPGPALTAATTRDQGRAALGGLTVSQLRDVAAANGVTIGSSWTKAKIRDAILQQLVGRRLDSAAIHQMTAPKKSARQIMQTGG